MGPALLAYVCEHAPGIRFRFYAAEGQGLLDDLDADRLDLGIGIGAFAGGQMHHKQRLLSTDTYLVMFNAEKVHVKPPISLEDYVRLPHVLTSLRRGERGVVDEALEKLGLSRKIALVTPRFVAVPFLVAGAAVVTTMHAKIGTLFCRKAGPQPQSAARRTAGAEELAAVARLLRHGSRAHLAARHDHSRCR